MLRVPLKTALASWAPSINIIIIMLEYHHYYAIIKRNNVLLHDFPRSTVQMTHDMAPVETYHFFLPMKIK